jgi:acyl-CoA synthetase (AMP-forming)/AMP-acid ligase II
MVVSSGWPGDPELTLMSGGEALPPDLATALRERSRELFNLYGPTETTIYTNGAAVENTDQPLSVGPVLLGNRAYVLDDNLEPVPVGVVGRVYLSGTNLARGYTRAASATAERFIPDPFADRPGERLYDSGDLARYMPDFRIEVLGRSDYQFKIHGVRAEPEEIEAALTRHPGIVEAAVAPVREQDAQRLVAYIVRRYGSTPDVAELRQHLKCYLPDPLIPSAFVDVERLPRTANGKFDRRAVSKWGAPAPSPRREHVAPSTDAERYWVRLWGEVLHTDGIGITDNFFELGGDSLLAVQIAIRATQEGQRLDQQDLFLYQTIAELAAARGGDNNPELKRDQNTIAAAQ